MATNKIDGIINGLNLFNTLIPGTEVKLRGYMLLVPAITKETLSPEQLEDLTEWGWAPSEIKDAEGAVVPGYEGFIFAGDV